MDQSEGGQQHPTEPCPLEDVMWEKEMIPDGWNIRRETGNTQHDLDTINKKKMIPGGRNSQWEAQNTQYGPGPV